uniref:Uncharacterized protein n=1 Tax=Pyrodinium bahamense TaxID=73915 RepID=A0A7R9ZXV3_9DINO
MAGAGLAGALATPLCDASRAGGLPRIAGDGLDVQRCLARLFVALWMRAVAASQHPAAYELLAKLCAQHIVSLQEAAADTAVVGADAEPSVAVAGAAAARGEALAACASVLAEAIAYRNERSLSTEGWGVVATGESPADGRGLRGSAAAACKPGALRDLLRGALQPASGRRLSPVPGVAALEALLPLL